LRRILPCINQGINDMSLRELSASAAKKLTTKAFITRNWRWGVVPPNFIIFRRWSRFSPVLHMEIHRFHRSKSSPKSIPESPQETWRHMAFAFGNMKGSLWPTDGGSPGVFRSIDGRVRDVFAITDRQLNSCLRGLKQWPF